MSEKPNYNKGFKEYNITPIFQALANIYNRGHLKPRFQDNMCGENIDLYTGILKDFNWHVDYAIAAKKAELHMTEHENKAYDATRMEQRLVEKSIREKAESLPKIKFNEREKVGKFVEYLIETDESSEFDLDRLRNAHMELRMNGYKTLPKFTSNPDL